jgi:hypothetical protein
MEENHKNLMIASPLAKISAWDLPDMKEYWQLDHNIYSYIQSATEWKLITFLSNFYCKSFSLYLCWALFIAWGIFNVQNVFFIGASPHC